MRTLIIKNFFVVTNKPSTLEKEIWKVCRKFAKSKDIYYKFEVE